MKKVMATVVSLVFVIGMIGCATIPMESNLDEPVSMTDVKETPVKSFTSDSRAIWLFWGIIPVGIPEIDGILVPQMAGHTGIQNLKITTESDALDLIVTILTDGVIFMRTVTVEGEVYD